ncbi:helix-turn-helix domain-containing protein [Caulobacter endophyticus]|nr:helix-turn-helix transcriptional regulator [Caulobacter endophyticus]
MRFSIPGDVLRHAREQAGVKQSALAKTLDTNGTFVSRLEKGGAVDPTFAVRYLQALASPVAEEVLEFYGRSWVKLDPPSFLHPDREHLWRVEETLQTLEAFEQSPQNHPILAPTITALRDDLSFVLRYLERLDHVIAWVGDIGVGKTTALAHAARLVSPDAKGQLRSVFPVGSGRITVCETVIKTAPAFGVAVEPLAEDAIRDLVQDLVQGVAGGQSAVPAEIARVLRNLSGFRAPKVMVGDDFETQDSIAIALAGGEEPATLTDKIIAAMDLPSRRETSLALSEDSEDGLQWLSRTIAKINSGQDPRFSVPRRITVLVPSDSLKAAGDLSIVDTKGVETITQRPDLRGYIDDVRTLVVLCTKFPDAPNATVQRVLRENEEAGSDAAERQRVAMLVLPRGDEPLQVSNEGEPAESRAVGCAVRRDEIRQALSGAGLPKINVSFYDAHLDRPEVVWASLRDQISLMRGVYVGRLDRSVRAVNEMVANVDLVKTRGARKSIENAFDRLIERVQVLPNVRRPAHQNLIDQLTASHQSSVAASMARRGDWQNFSVLHILGVGVRQDANLRSSDHFGRIEHALEDAEQEYADLPDVRAVISSLRDRLAKWRQDFLTQTLSIGSDAFKLTLQNQPGLWTESTGRYGTGVPGYKKDLAVIWQDFFQTAAPDDARAAVEARLAEAWLSTIVEPLRAATRAVAED